MVPKRIHPEEYEVINPKHLSVFGDSACHLIEMLNLVFTDELGRNDPPLFPSFFDEHEVENGVKEHIVEGLLKTDASQEARQALSLYKAPTARLLLLVGHSDPSLAALAKTALEGAPNPMFDEFFKYADIDNYHRWLDNPPDDEDVWWDLLEIEKTHIIKPLVAWLEDVAKKAVADFGTAINPLCYFDESLKECKGDMCCIRMAFGSTRWDLYDTTGKLRAYAKETGYTNRFTDKVYLLEE